MTSGLITTAITNALLVKHALEAVLAHTGENDHKKELNRVLQKVGVIQDTLFDARSELSRLQAENQQLRQELQACIP
jgi:hypothetical protein